MNQFEIVDDTHKTAVTIKVIGVGGCGNKAINHMIENHLTGVEFIAANTDLQTLERSQAAVRVQLGPRLTRGLGAGSMHEKGAMAAEESREEIARYVGNADMLFIAAGMGGGTGTGASPVIARIARENNPDMLIVAVVTKPFDYELRTEVASEGLRQLEEQVNGLIVVSNEKLLEVLDRDVTERQAYATSNEVLRRAVSAIAEIIQKPGETNVDFEDIRTVMNKSGICLMATSTASGDDRVEKVLEDIFNYKLLEDVSFEGIQGVVVNITAIDGGLLLREASAIRRAVSERAAPGAKIIVGSTVDESLGDALRLTLVATGINQNAKKHHPHLRVLEPLQRTGTHDASAYSNPSQPTLPGLEATSERPSSLASDITGMATEVPGLKHGRQGVIDNLRRSGVLDEDIPAFLRRQAD